MKKLVHYQRYLVDSSCYYRSDKQEKGRDQLKRSTVFFIALALHIQLKIRNNYIGGILKLLLVYTISYTYMKYICVYVCMYIYIYIYFQKEINTDSDAMYSKRKQSGPIALSSCFWLG